jgi:hypothetical protein
MSPWLRAALFAAGFAGAFCLGQLLTRPATTAPPSVTLVAAAPIPERSIQTPMMEPPAIMPPVGPPTSTDELEVNKNDLAFKVIEKGLGIDTTVVDRSEPPPTVLVQASKEDVPAVSVPGIKVPENGVGADLQPPLPADPRPPEPRISDLDPPAPDLRIGSVMVNPPTKLLNTRSVALDFQVTKVGLSPVKAVELWVTRDGGKTWEKCDRVEGARSPFRTRIPGPDGVYGFKLVFESESGMRTAEPKSRQAPDQVLELDTTPPTVRVFPVQAIPNQSGTVLISWDAVDPHIDHATVRLEYSLDARQWHLITTGKQVTVKGRFAWKVPNELPPKLFLRVSASDMAGNTGVAQTSEQMSIDLVAPEGKITGIRPDTTDHRGPMPRVIDAADEPPAAVVPVEDLLKSLIPVVLNSPGPATSSEATETDRSAHDHCDTSLVSSRGSWQVFQNLATQLSRGVWDCELESVEFEFVYMRCAEHSLRFAVVPTSVLTKSALEKLLAVAPALHRNDFFRLFAGFYVGTRPAWSRLQLVQRLQDTDQFHEWRDHGRKTTEAVSSGRSVLKVLTDTDWKPSTATPDSFQSREPIRPGRPFDGAYDGPFWGSFPGPGIVLDF